MIKIFIGILIGIPLGVVGTWLWIAYKGLVVG